MVGYRKNLFLPVLAALLAVVGAGKAAGDSCVSGFVSRGNFKDFNCKCWADLDSKRYLLEDLPMESRPKTKKGRPMQLGDGENNNWSFRCNYTCQDSQGTAYRFCGVVSERRTRTSSKSNDPGDSATICASAVKHGNSYSPNPTRVDPHARSSETFLGSMGFKRFEYQIFPDTLVQWARKNGCIR